MSRLLTTVNLGGFFALPFVSSLILSIGVCAAESPVTVSPKPTTAGTTKAVKVKEDLPNFHQVHPFLYRGGEPTKEGLRKAKEMGITTIFDLRNPGEMAFDEKAAAKELGMTYVSMPMNSKAPTAKQIKKLVDAIDRAKGNTTETASPGQSVFVHCAHGSDRTGCMVGIWRVMRDGYDYDTAYKEMRKYWFTPKFTNLSGAVKTAADGVKVQAN